MYLLDLMRLATSVCLPSGASRYIMFAEFVCPAGGLEMPSAVYLLDVMRPGRRVAEVLDLVRPVLASQQNTKVGPSVRDDVCYAGLAPFPSFYVDAAAVLLRGLMPLDKHGSEIVAQCCR